jgi:hypothetical protein
MDTRGVTTIIVDALNWLDDFWSWKRARHEPWQELVAFEKRVKKFVDAALLSGFAVVAVIDSDTETKEAARKWRLRRNKELRYEDRRMVLGIDSFLSEALRRNGVRVVRPLVADADDVIASFAVASGAGACVLSKDSDFFRYAPSFRVCNGWYIQKGRLQLKPAATGSTSSAMAREVDLSLAERGVGADRDGENKYNPSMRRGWIIRGCTSSSDKKMGNLHEIVRPLRAAVYARLGEDSAMEKLPEWIEETNSVSWVDTEVAADASLDALLDDPEAVLAWIEEREGPECDETWRNVERAFNRCALVAEMCATASEGSKSALDIQQSLAKRLPRHLKSA